MISGKFVFKIVSKAILQVLPKKMFKPPKNDNHNIKSYFLLQFKKILNFTLLF